jgi:ankyrin repeat protein
MDLIDAAEDGDNRLVQELLDSGADINFRDRNGNTALMMASAWGYTKMGRLLLEKGADYNNRDIDGSTPLMIAAYERDTEMVQLLLDKGADPNIRDNDGSTPLMIAAYEGNTEMVQLLLDKGADPTIMDYYGHTAFRSAVENQNRVYSPSADIVELLKPHYMSTKIQSRVRGRQTRNEINTQKALQQLKASLLPVDYDLSRMIGEQLNRIPYNPKVAKRIKEERENEQIADYLKTLAQYGGKKKHKKTKRKPKKTKKRKKKPKSKKKK